MARKNGWVFFFLVVFTFFLTGCDLFNQATSLTTTEPPVTTTSVTSEDSELTQQLRLIFQLAVEAEAFDGTYDEWLETVRGPEGLPGREVMLRVAEGYIQWQYSGDTTWNNLIDLVSLTGTDGREVVFQTLDGFLQWQYVGDVTWNNLFDLVSLTGPAGADGNEVIFQVSDGYIQWQYTGDTTWTNLIDLISLTGPKGADGATGTDGKEIELRVNDNHLEWRRVGEVEWAVLYDLLVLKGQDATFPVITINDEGYWVIDGVVQTQRAYTLEMHVVTFDLQGGTLPGDEPLSINVEHGYPVELPIPVKEGYVFTGWITGTTANDGMFSRFMPVVRDLALIARWEINYSLVNDFFNTVDHNHAFTYDLDVTFTDDIHTYTFFMDDVYYYNNDGLMPYSYLNQSIYFDFPNFSSGSQSKEIYTQYNLADLMAYTARAQGSDWRFAQMEEWALYDHYLAGIDETKFVILNDGLRFDYTGDMDVIEQPFIELLSIYSITLNDILTYASRSAILDLSTQTLTYVATGKVDTYLLGMLDFTFSVTYAFETYDETTMTLPLADLKQNLVDQFNALVALKYNDPYLDYVFDYSLLEFETFVSEKQALLTSLTTFADLVAFYQTDLQALQVFTFEYDTTGQLIAEFIGYLNRYYLEKSALATQESIADMYAIYQDYEAGARALDTEFEDVLRDQLYVLGQQYTTRIQEALIYDLNKVAFHQYQIAHSDYIAVFSSYLAECIDDSESQNEYYLLIESWMNLIMAQTTIDEVNLVFQQAITDITNVTYPMSSPSSYYLNVQGYLIDMSYAYVDMMAIYGDQLLDTMDYYTLIETQGSHLRSTSSDPHQWVVVWIDSNMAAFDYLVTAQTPILGVDLQAYVSERMQMLTPEDQVLLQNELNQVLLLMPEALTLIDLNQLVAYFYQNAQRFEDDPWLTANTEAFNRVFTEYDYYMVLSTVESQGVLTGIYNQFLLDLESLTYNDFEGLDVLVETALAEFMVNYIVAAEFVELENSKTTYLNEFEAYYLMGLPYINPLFQPINSLEDTYYALIDRMAHSLSISELEQYYNEGYYLLSYADIVYYPIDDLQQQLDVELTAYVEEWFTEFSILSNEVTYELNYFKEDIYGYLSPYQTYDVYRTHQKMIDDAIMVAMVNEFYLRLDTAYNEYYLTVDIEKLGALTDLYYTYQDQLMLLPIFEEEIPWSYFTEFMADFHADVALL